MNVGVERVGRSRNRTRRAPGRVTVVALPAVLGTLDGAASPPAGQRASNWITGTEAAA